MRAAKAMGSSPVTQLLERVHLGRIDGGAGLTDIILCEVLQGVRDKSTTEDVKRQLLKFDVFESGGVDLASEAARNYRILRSRGHTVRKTVDCLIATFCIRDGHSLLHRDRDFDPLEQYLELSVVHA